MAKLVAQAILPVLPVGDSHRLLRPDRPEAASTSECAKNGDCPCPQPAWTPPARAGLFVLLALLLSACGTTLPPENTKPVVTIVGAKLIDGSDAEPIEDAVIVIEGTRIRTVGPRSHTPVPKGGEIVDGAGKVVIPGLVDVHVHYLGGRAEMERALWAQLYFGVTTVRSIGADTGEHLLIIEDLRAGRIPGPRIYTAGRGFVHPEGHPTDNPLPLRPATPEEAREQVRLLASQDVDFLKIWVDSQNGTSPKITPEVRAAIVEEANKHHIPVVAHLYEQEDVYQLGDLGVNDFLHTVRDLEPLDEKFLEFAKSRQISFAPTLTVIERHWYFAENPKGLEDPEVRFGMNAEALAVIENNAARRQRLEDPELTGKKAELAQAQRFVKQMREAGIELVVGSDSGAGEIPAGWGTHREMALMVEAGLPPLEVLRLATRRGAERLVGPKAEFGTVEAGKIADLILLDADPLEDIANTRKINRVMQAGQWLERQMPSVR